MAAKPQPPVGIDLGTTYSVVACLDASGRPETVPNSSGDRITPSALLFEDGEVVVGKEASRESVIMPLSFADCFKRDMGGDEFRRQVNNVKIPPEVLSGFLLERLKRDAEDRLGPIRQVVVTVPAFFDESRRKATQDAGRLAGLDVLDIINEPTAAAVAVGLAGDVDDGQLRRVLVYDLGGGTFDVTILEIQGKEFKTLATDGDVQLGGKDWDQRLVNHFAEEFQTAHGLDPRTDPSDAAQLWLDAQETKHTLSERNKAKVVVHHSGLRHRLEVTREQFASMTSDLLARTETTSTLVVKDAGLSWSDIDRVILVGGSSRMPQVGVMLRRVTGKEPDRSASPDEAVAHGAALYCGMLMGAGRKNYRFTNVNSHSLGVVGVDMQTGRKTNVILIPKNSPLPCEKTRTFRTAKAGQRSVVATVVEGESRRPDDCVLLGRCVVRNLPANLPSKTAVHVTYKYAANGRISVTARVPDAHISAQVDVEREKHRRFESLEAWKAHIFGQQIPAGASSSSAPANHRASVMRRLDELFTMIGQKASKVIVPQALAKSQNAAAEAAEATSKAQRRLSAAEKKRREAVSPSEAIQVDAELAARRSELEKARKRSNFAFLVLGRETLAAGIDLPDVKKELAEAKRLKGTIESDG